MTELHTTIDVLAPVRAVWCVCLLNQYNCSANTNGSTTGARPDCGEQFVT